MAIDSTHNPDLKSWVESANDPATDFPIQNLPLCVYARPEDKHESGHVHDDGGVSDHGHIHPRIGVMIGDQILDLELLVQSHQLGGDEEFGTALEFVMQFSDLDAIASMPRPFRTELRKQIQNFLLDNAAVGQSARRIRTKCLTPAKNCTLLPPFVRIPNYTDFYASIHHAFTVGTMFRPDNALLPNYKHVPIGYHGRASSIIASGEDIFRPSGQQSPPDDQPGAMPTFGPCKLLDYEMELGCFIAGGNTRGEPIAIADAEENILGLCILNDWSARDLQKWEYQPLGPFLAKNFASTISPAVISIDALEPFRCPGPERTPEDPQPLPYLSDPSLQTRGGFDITLEVFLSSAQMREKGFEPVRLSRGNFKHMYWTFSQMIAHHTSNGCNLQAGDLLGSGTASGPTADSRGCMLELTWDGIDPATKKPKPRKPVQLPTGETRTFLADGDEIIMRAFCEKPGFRRIGFGECRGIIYPARETTRS